MDANEGERESETLLLTGVYLRLDLIRRREKCSPPQFPFHKQSQNVLLLSSPIMLENMKTLQTDRTSRLSGNAKRVANTDINHHYAQYLLLSHIHILIRVYHYNFNYGYFINHGVVQNNLVQD